MKFGPFWFVVAKGGMDKTGARKLPLAVLNERRRRAVKLRERGLLLREVAAQVELSVPTVMAAHRAYLAGGWSRIPTARCSSSSTTSRCILPVR